MRAYFPTDKSVQYAIKLAERLYRNRDFVERKVPCWHEGRALLRRLRAHAAGNGKRAHSSAAFISICIRATASTTTRRRFGARGLDAGAAHADLGAGDQLQRKGLNHDELETLLHEFGHVLHGVLSKTRYADQSGTSVKRDFVEAPSQMFEEWARREEALKLFAKSVRSARA